jgi:hypothetical protein
VAGIAGDLRATVLAKSPHVIVMAYKPKEVL